MTTDPAGPADGLPAPVLAALDAVRGAGVQFVRRYHRLRIEHDALGPHDLDEPVLLVANHGFGAVFDLNVFAILATLDELRLRRPVTVLTHQLAWTLRVGRLLEPFGARPASHREATEAFARGHHVLVLPGGDVEAAKTFTERHRVVFAGRTGFARLALERGVPIVPIVTSGAGGSLLVLSAGTGLARALRVDRTLRMKALPVSVSLPWGLNVGIVGLVPYLPLPSRLRTRVLAPVQARPDESAEQLATRVHAVMQVAMTDLAATGRRSRPTSAGGDR